MQALLPVGTVAVTGDRVCAVRGLAMRTLA
jgi:hypothetical protein